MAGAWIARHCRGVRFLSLFRNTAQQEGHYAWLTQQPYCKPPTLFDMDSGAKDRDDEKGYGVAKRMSIVSQWTLPIGSMSFKLIHVHVSDSLE